MSERAAAAVRPSTHGAPAGAPGAPDIRQIVGFSFYGVSPEWRRLPRQTRQKHGDQLIELVNRHKSKVMIRTFSLVGLKAGVEFLLWRVGSTVEAVQEIAADLRTTDIAGYLTTPYEYLSMTKRSSYVDKIDPDHQDRRRYITPADSKYLFVYPFVKSREWYLLSQEERQGMMDEHIRVGNKYPSVRLHTTYSFGMDDQDFVVAFETDKPQDFLDLVMELRGTVGSKFTVRDTPIFTCVAKPMGEIVKDIGG